MVDFTFHRRQGVYMQLVLFEKYRVIDIDIGSRDNNLLRHEITSRTRKIKSRWIEIRIWGLGLDYNIQNEKRWFNSFYNKLWTRG